MADALHQPFENQSFDLVWSMESGEHMHHGYYPKGHAPKSNSQAQIDMIEETLTWAGVKDASKASLTLPRP